MKAKDAVRWRKPSPCECGARMTLQLVSDFWALVCYRYGKTKGAEPSIKAEKASA